MWKILRISMYTSLVMHLITGVLFGDIDRLAALKTGAYFGTDIVFRQISKELNENLERRKYG